MESGSGADLLVMIAASTDNQLLQHTLFHLAGQLWWLWVLIGGGAVGKAVCSIYLERRLARSGIDEIDRMDGGTFEHYLGTLFERLGYTVKVTKYQGDYGADLVITKDGVSCAVQAKRWSKNVGLKAVQEAVTARAYYDCDRSMVVANRSFTRQAIELAHVNNVELWDRDVLVSKLLEAPANPEPSSIAPPLTPATTLAAATTCARCGVTVSEKVRSYCIDHAERFGGRVLCFTHQRNQQLR